MPGKRIKVNGEYVELTPKQYDEYILIMNNLKMDGKLNLKEYLNRLVTENKHYKDNTDEIKTKKIEIIIGKARDIARATMVKKLMQEEKEGY
jgi:hypothetical protein